MGTHVPAQNERRVHDQSCRLGVDASIVKAGTGERASKGASRGDARTVEMRSVPELLRTRRLPAGAAARTSRAPPPAGSRKRRPREEEYS